MMQLQATVGIVAILLIAWVLGEQRRAASWRDAARGLALTMALALLLLKVPGAKAVFAALTLGVDAVAAATRAGTSFVFGYLGGGELPFDPKVPGSEFILAFQALPLILVVGVLTALLFHWRIMPIVVRGFAWALRRSLHVGGAVGLSTAVNIFVGMVEAPLFIKPYLKQLSRSEVFVVMTGGMAGIAGTVMVLYATFLAASVPDAFGHILIASVLAAPGAITVARLMVPETAAPTAAESGGIVPSAHGAMDAISKATLAGVELVVNVVAMLIVLVALVHLANAILSLLPEIAGGALTLQRALGWVMAPLCWLMGVPWSEAAVAGQLMGTKTVLNELVAYVDLAKIPGETLSPRSRLIMTYALCGFANFGSLGIMIGGLTTMVPERRGEIIELGLKSVIAGTLTTCLLGAIIGVLTPAA